MKMLLPLLLALMLGACTSQEDGTTLIQGIDAMQVEHARSMSSWSNLNAKSNASSEVKAAVSTAIAASLQRMTTIAASMKLTVSKLMEVDAEALLQQAVGTYNQLGGPAPPPLNPEEGGGQ